MIETRDYEPVCEWLKSYPKLEVISRDGSVTYKNAIEAAHPKATQVSDRFHLLKNLTEYALEYLRKHLKAQIAVPSEKTNVPCEDAVAVLSKASENRKLTSAEKCDKIEKLSRLGYPKTHVCKALNMDLRFYEKLIAMTPVEREAMFTTKQEIIREEKIELKMKRVNEVRELKAACFSNRAISRRTGLDHRTVAKYIDMNFNPVHAMYGTKRVGILTPYIKEIDSMLEVGTRGSDITQKIQERGYRGSGETVRHYIADWKRRRKHLYDGSNNSDTLERVEIIERKDVFKLLFHTLEKSKCISSDVFEKLCALYPCFQKVHDIVWEFRNLLKAKDTAALASWLTKALALKIREIKSFVDGVKRDFKAVSNAVKLDYSNGLAEGKINKLKLIKRIMYGRCHFSTLRNKVLLIENPNFFN
jgi:hypothetical protein